MSRHATLVSVLTPTYNGERFLAETLDSVLAQSHPTLEHIVVDDGSTDATRALVEEYQARHPTRIRLVPFAENAGPCRRRNDALALARGDYVAWLDHDDLWLPEKIERQLEALERDARAGFAYTQFELFDDATAETIQRSRIHAEDDVLEQLFLQSAFFASSTVLIRREAMVRRDLRFRDSDFSFGDDLFLWLSLALDWRGVLVDEVLTRLRRHGANESVRLARQNFYPRSIGLLDEFVRTYPEAVARLGSARRVGVARHYALAAIYELERGSKHRAALYAARAAAGDPAGARRYTAGRVRRALAGIR